MFHPYFEIFRIHPQNTTEYTVFSRIHTEYTQNTQRAKTPKSALRAIHVITSQQRAKYRRRIRILQNTHFLIVLCAYSVRVLAYSVRIHPREGAFLGHFPASSGGLSAFFFDLPGWAVCSSSGSAVAAAFASLAALAAA